VQASLSAGGYTFNNFNFSYDKVGNLTTLQNTAQMPGSFPIAALGNAIGGRGPRPSPMATSTG
jgi:hypothetical protein